MPWVDADKIAKDLAATDAETGITVRGVDFQMPAKLPLSFPYYLMQEEVTKALRSLFGDRVDELMELAGPDLSIDWLRDVVDAVYGESGEASASSRPSSKTRSSTARSKRTSAASTRKR